MFDQKDRFAVISDIHGNLESIEAVFAEIEKCDVHHVICLGDVVGYGADFETCIDIVSDRCEVVLCGNHDEAVITGPTDFNPVAREVIEYTRSSMKPGIISSSRKRFRWSFLRELKKEHKEGVLSYYHGSPRDPVKEYIMRTDVIFAPDKLYETFQLIDKACFIGHTHQPGVIVEGANFSFYDPEKLGNRFDFGSGKAIINVGSVGQPRDGDSRASFVVVEDGAVLFKRVEYDFHAAMANPGIHDNCAARLAIGK